ncbi:sensor histidine kinase [Arenibacterium sp. LLYu02]|uniref:sensor histidine kinase n=1 Tax=Arenibacterium sp. LLYu02 TaxID=3404132 RepID=UPI003B21F090
MTAMPPPPNQLDSLTLAESYRAALADFLASGDEQDLTFAFDWARIALAANLSIGDLGDIHFRALKLLPNASLEVPSRAEEFFLETLSVYDMALRGYGESVARLTAEIQERRRVEEELRTATEMLARERDHLESTVAARTRELQDRVRDLKQLNQQLRHSNQEQAQFTYAISHDLKSPVNTVAMMLNLLESESLAPDAQELVDAARATTARMGMMIHDILDYSSLVGQEPQFETVDLQALANDVVTDLRAAIVETGAQITISDLPHIRGIPAQLRSLFQNLISNAIKFHTPGQVPQIAIKAALDTPQCALEITFSDNGIGIDKDYHDRIFSLFQRLHTFEEYAGSGIGLTLCQRIVGYHRGDIRVRSAKGEGSHFIVRLWVEEGKTHDGSQTCDDRR